MTQQVLSRQVQLSPLRYCGSGTRMDTVITYSDSPSRLLIPTSADTGSCVGVLLKPYHHWQRRNKTWHGAVLHHGFLPSPSGCLLPFITVPWRRGHRLCLLLPAWWTPRPPCCVVVQPPLQWVVGQDIADQFHSNYCSLFSLKIIIIFSAWGPVVSNPKFMEVKKPPPFQIW